MDILPVDDFGVREGYRKLHGLEAQPKPRDLAAIGEMWSPWRSVAAWYLWRAAEEGRGFKQPS
jgi:DNA-3-methyladenine glycosylase II